MSTTTQDGLPPGPIPRTTVEAVNGGPIVLFEQHLKVRPSLVAILTVALTFARLGSLGQLHLVLRRAGADRGSIVRLASCLIHDKADEDG